MQMGLRILIFSDATELYLNEVQLFINKIFCPVGEPDDRLIVSL